MGNKFVSLIVTAAVCLGLMLVPMVGSAVIAQTPAPAGNATFWAYEAGQPTSDALARIGLGGSFTMNITVANNVTPPTGLTGGDSYLCWNATLLSVTSITQPAPANGGWPVPWPIITWNNTEGCLDVSGGILMTNVTTDVNHAQISFVSTGVAGTAWVNFTATGMCNGTGPFNTVINKAAGGTVDCMDWASVQNFMVQIGNPTLTVTKVGEGTVTANGTPLVFASSNTTSWSWDANVTLVATPAVGWQFSSWTDQDGPNAATTYEIMDNSAESVTVTFTEKEPVLDVSPTDFVFEARLGRGNPADQTLNVTNTGGKLLSWTVGDPPTWTLGDNWTMFNGYLIPPSTPWPWFNATLPGSYNNTLYLYVSAVNTNTYNVTGTMLPWPYGGPAAYGAQRVTTTGGGITNVPCVVWDATAVVDKYHMDYVSYAANLTIYLGPGPYAPQTVPVTWTYWQADHGWPYYGGKTWSYNVTVTDITGTKSQLLFAKVTGYVPVTTTAGTFDCWQITHYLNPGDITNTTVTQQYWNDTAKQIVSQWDVTFFDPPPPHGSGAVDVRSMMAYNTADPAAVPSWLTVSPTHGSVGVSGKDTVTLSVNSSAMLLGWTNCTFNITAPGSIQSAPIKVGVFVKPAREVPIMRDLPGNATLPNCTYPGDKFKVYVNFSSPEDYMNAISLTDLAPDGWMVSVDRFECTPTADVAKAAGNKVEIGWFGPAGVGFPEGTDFTAVYWVTVPATAKAGLNYWPNCDVSKAWAEYYFGEDPNATKSCVNNEYQMLITVPGYVVGETRDVNHNSLPDTNVTLMRDTSSVGADESSPDYSIICRNTGVYWLNASKYMYISVETPWVANATLHPGSPGWNINHTQYIDWSTPESLALSYHLVSGVNMTHFDFEGDYGLVPLDCSFSYAMRSVNLWLFWPSANQEWGLSGWKAAESIHSWQYPPGT